MPKRLSNSEQIAKINRECKLRLAPSNIHGIGVHALFDLPKGTKLYADLMPQVYTLPYANFSKLHKEIRELVLERWPQIVNGSAFIYPDCRMMAYMNHSDDFNVAGDVTLRDVKKGEELTEDYRAIPGWEKVFHWLPPKEAV